MKYNKQGHCPFCNSENIEYKQLEVVDNSIYYPAVCLECSKYFKEWYTLEFCEITE